MKTFPRVQALLLSALLAACASVPTAPTTASGDSQEAARSAWSAFERHDNLDATVWMQTSAEYRAVLLGAYALARQQLDAALADPCWDALPEGERDNDPCGLPPTIIADADETLIDNTAFQVRKIRYGIDFEYGNWLSWVNERRARALPGVRDFLDYVAERGVTVHYITNRDHPAERAATIENLRALGFPMQPGNGNLLLRGDPRAPARGKGERRRWVGQNHRVLLLLGDNLGDFVDGYASDRASREALVDDHDDRWGRQWIMLPNPGYGSWEATILTGCDRSTSVCKRAALRDD